MEDLGYNQHGDDLPEPKLFCVKCEDIIEPNEQYIDFDGDPWCKTCFRIWEEEHTKWS